MRVLSKNLLLTLMVFGIVGCASIPSQSQIDTMSDVELCTTKYSFAGEQRYPFIKEELVREIDCNSLMSNIKLCKAKYSSRGEERYPHIKEELRRKIDCNEILIDT